MRMKKKEKAVINLRERERERERDRQTDKKIPSVLIIRFDLLRTLMFLF